MGEKGQAVIPKAIRDAVGIAAGDTLTFRVEGRKVVVEKAERSDIVAQLRGLVPRKTKEPRRIDWDAEYADRFGGK